MTSEEETCDNCANDGTGACDDCHVDGVINWEKKMQNMCKIIWASECGAIMGMGENTCRFFSPDPSRLACKFVDEGLWACENSDASQAALAEFIARKQK